MKALLFVLCFCLTGYAGNEAKGGHPAKDRFRRTGRFLVYHLEKKQVRLSFRLKDFAKFKSVVNTVPVKIVKELPPLSSQVEELVGTTVSDAESPVGKSILLHEARFTAALAEFDAGNEVTLKSFDLIERSFLSWIFHEYLLAAGESDENSQISNLLSATRQHLDEWSQWNDPLKDIVISAHLPFMGTFFSVVEGARPPEDASLEKFYKIYDSVGHINRESRYKAVVDAVSKKVQVLKADFPKPNPVLENVSFLNPDYDTTNPLVRAAYTKRSVFSSLFHHDPGELKVYVETDRKVGQKFLADISSAPQTHQEVKDGRLNHDRNAVLPLILAAYSDWLAKCEALLPDLTQKYERIYGEDFFFVQCGAPTLTKTGRTAVSYTVQPYPYFKFQGFQTVDYVFTSKPYAVFLEDQD